MSPAQNQTFANLDFTTTGIPFTECEGCVFTACNFSGADLSNLRFVDCRFSQCDCSNAKLNQATLNGAAFTNCKLLGLHFEDCSEFLFSVSFEGCTLDFSSFYQRSLKKTAFLNCSLQSVDFTEANLAAASFAGCDLANAVFENTVLEKADFRGARQFSIDPERNRLYGARFDRDALEGLLQKYGLRIG